MELFKNKLLLGLREARIDLIAKLKAALLTIPAFSSRDELRQKLREALMENQERLGEAAINLGGAMVNATIGNWLKKYERELGARPVGSLDLNQFFASDKDIQNLSPADQIAARRLFSLHDYLKLSSQTPEGLEDPVIFAAEGQLKKLRGGEWEDVKVETKLATILDKVFKFFNPAPSATEPATVAAPSFDLVNVVKLALSLLTETKGELAVLRDALDKAINSQARDRALGIILLLAQLRRLDDILSDDERFVLLVAEDLKKSGQDDKVEGLRLNPTAPNFIARFLKVVLQDKLNLAEAEALGFAQKLAGLLALEGEKYSRIVISGEDGKLRWNL